MVLNQKGKLHYRSSVIHVSKEDGGLMLHILKQFFCFLMCLWLKIIS